MQPPTTGVSLSISLSSVTRVVGSPSNFQSAVNTSAAQLLTLVKKNENKRSFFFSGKKSEIEIVRKFDENSGIPFSYPLSNLKHFLPP